jgi:hypothetical protein
MQVLLELFRASMYLENALLTVHPVKEEGSLILVI